MKSLSIREMRQALGKLDQILAEEHEITVTRHGRPIARVLPVEPLHEMPSHTALRSRTPRLSASVELLREDRDARG